MPEEITDQEREELKNERETRKKKEMTIDEIMACPTWDCDGGPEIVKVRNLGGNKEMWQVWCPTCRGWVSYYIIGEGQDPYVAGSRIWEEMRREQGH